MAVLPAAAAAAYQAIAQIGGSTGAASSAVAGTNPVGGFGEFLTKAVQDGIGTMKQGETMAARQVAGQANIVDVVGAVNQAEITLDTVVAVRDKVVQAYQSIMNMPI
jgi:flagellar hook-basal body complex protein FliE